MTLVRNRSEPIGQEFGKILAKWCDDAEPIARLQCPDLPPRCPSCAFREGNHVANGSVTTVMDALKCVVEQVPFLCHQPARGGCLCSGYLMMIMAHADGQPHKTFWPFSDETQKMNESSSSTARKD